MIPMKSTHKYLTIRPEKYHYCYCWTFMMCCCMRMVEVSKKSRKVCLGHSRVTRLKLFGVVYLRSQDKHLRKHLLAERYYSSITVRVSTGTLTYMTYLELFVLEKKVSFDNYIGKVGL